MEIVKKIFSVIWEIIKWFFVTGWGLTVLILALIDLWLGDGSWWRDLRANNKKAGNIERIKEQLPNMTLEELLKQFGDSLK